MLLIVLLSCRPDPLASRPGLRLNEVMSANDSMVRDPANVECPEFDDWIEVVNSGENPVDLGKVQLWVSDDVFALQGTLAPGEHQLVWADDDVEQGEDHAPFKVSAVGERVELREGAFVLDGVDMPPSPRDQSYGRVTDGTGAWAWFQVPTPGVANQRVLPDDPCFQLPTPFDDHSYPCLSTAESFTALSGDRTALQVVKFDIFAFGSPADRRIAYVDTDFYTLHDQYYLFRLFNNQVFEGIYDHRPFDGSFATWGELESWARTIDLALVVSPDMARFSGERLFSRTFYDRINGHPRVVGVGTIIHRPQTEDKEEFWGFELEYVDSIRYDDLVVYFETLAASGPPEFDTIHWLIRSADQEALAQQMESENLRYADQITRYSELATKGDVEVYHPGLTAGRVRTIRAGEPGLDASLASDILVLDEIPDELPPCAALITSVPQTPLSHISLLARSRGIPNLYVAGITDDAEWDAWSRRSTWIALEANDDGSLRAVDLGIENYTFWQTLQVESLPELEPVDVDGLPFAIDLATAGSMLELRPVVGGKAAGMRQLLLTDGVDTPDTPLGISVRGYHAHLEGLPWLDEVLDAFPFVGDGPNAAMRFLVLEGRTTYDDRYDQEADQFAADAFVATQLGTTTGELAAGEGLRGRVVSTPMPSDVRAELFDAVQAQFAWLDPAAGLRFRSSSTVEDIEGFNGAGLYISKTGFLAPEPGDRSVEDAVREVWASYWGAEAYEEREAAGIPHRLGGMGLVVHPRFDDEFERSNAVLTASRLPDGSMEVLVNAQEGAVSVANPPTTCPPVLPEALRMTDAGGSLLIERVGASSEVSAGDEVLNDVQAEQLFDDVTAVVDGWLAVENGALPVAQQRTVLTLDLESREMGAGWPIGSDSGDRLVVKQSRSLEPSAAGLPDEVVLLPAPRDVLARATRVERLTCTDGALEAWATWLYTDPRELPDMGYSSDPFVIEAGLVGTVDEGLWDHTVLEATEIDVGFFGFEAEGLVVEMGSAYTVDGPSGVVTGSADCVGETLWASPDVFLQVLLDGP